jgi:hypothetical protein
MRRDGEDNEKAITNLTPAVRTVGYWIDLRFALGSPMFEQNLVTLLGYPLFLQPPPPARTPLNEHLRLLEHLNEHANVR